jgi:serine/threonine protein kinase
VVAAEEFGPYRVYERLGVGGMAYVHRAELVAPNGQSKVVALKRLLPEIANEPSYVRRFIDEARLGQRLRHANIAKTFAVGNVKSTHFMALEYVRGPTLLQLLQRDIAPPLPITLHILKQVARALAYAHGLRDETGKSLRLIHRDIAPSNIIVSESGVTKLIDFGVAKASTGHVHTKAGAIIGKLGYVAPEYLASSQLDARVDLFSLGVVAYELLTERPLFNVKDLRAAEALRATSIDPPSTINPRVSPDLDDIVMTALQRDPDLRWQNAFAMFTALTNHTQESGLAATDADVAEWVGREQPPRAATEEPPMRTAEIEIDLELAFARAFSRTQPNSAIR